MSNSCPNTSTDPSDSSGSTETAGRVPITRSETGCLPYERHRDNNNNNNPTHFMFYENWESRELWQTHMAAPHLAACMQATEGAVVEFMLNEMTLIA